MSSMHAIHDLSNGKLNDRLLDKLHTIANSNGVVAVIVLPNVSDKENNEINLSIPGTVTIADGKSIINADLMPKSMFSTCALYEIEHDDKIESEGDHFFLSLARKLKLENAAKFSSECGASIDNIYLEDCAEKLIGKDKKFWDASLGSKGFWSILKQEKDNYDSKYHLFVSCSQDKLSQELTKKFKEIEAKEIWQRTSIESDKNPASFKTFADLSSSQLVVRSRKISEDNTNRCAHEIANFLGVSIASEESTTGKFNPETKGTYRLAKPVAMSFYGDISNSEIFYEGDTSESKLCTLLHSKSGSLQTFKGGSITLQHPRDGVMVQGRDMVINDGSIRNACANIVPLGTGYEETNLKSLPAHDKRFIHQKIFWPGKNCNASFDEQTTVPRLAEKQYQPSTVLQQFTGNNTGETMKLELVMSFCPATPIISD